MITEERCLEIRDWMRESVSQYDDSGYGVLSDQMIDDAAEYFGDSLFDTSTRTAYENEAELTVFEWNAKPIGFWASGCSKSHLSYSNLAALEMDTKEWLLTWDCELTRMHLEYMHSLLYAKGKARDLCIAVVQMYDSALNEYTELFWAARFASF